MSADCLQPTRCRCSDKIDQQAQRNRRRNPARTPSNRTARTCPSPDQVSTSKHLVPLEQPIGSFGQSRLDSTQQVGKATCVLLQKSLTIVLEMHWGEWRVMMLFFMIVGLGMSHYSCHIRLTMTSMCLLSTCTPLCRCWRPTESKGSHAVAIRPPTTRRPQPRRAGQGPTWRHLAARQRG